MTTDFEPLYAAFFTSITSRVTGLVTTGRRLRMWSELTPIQQPALFMAQTGELPSTVTGLPSKWTLTFDLYLYLNSGPAFDRVPAIELNAFLAQIRAAFAPDNLTRNAFTLGGLVQHCRIAGAIETFDGTLGDQSVAIIPVEILTV